MASISFDIALFRQQFPDFVNPPFTDAIIEGQWNIATCYITNEDYGCLSGSCRAYAINAMTAHLLQLGINTAAGVERPGGKTEGLVISATIDKVTVNMQEPPTDKGQFHWWLNQTPYGQALLALLKTRAVAGLYVGGLPERSAFRKVGGRF